MSAEGTLLLCEQIREVGDIDNALVILRIANGALKPGEGESDGN